MAWKGRITGQQDFNQLIKSLDNSGIQKDNNALYQVIFQLVQAAQKNKDLTVTQFITLTNLVDSISNTTIVNINANIAAVLASHLLTWTDESALYPNSRQLLAGSGITFNDTVPNERTIEALSAGMSYIPLSLGIEPLTFVSDGLGQPILVPYIP